MKYDVFKTTPHPTFVSLGLFDADSPKDALRRALPDRRSRTLVASRNLFFELGGTPLTTRDAYLFEGFTPIDWEDELALLRFPGFRSSAE